MIARKLVELEPLHLVHAVFLVHPLRRQVGFLVKGSKMQREQQSAICQLLVRWQKFLGPVVGQVNASTHFSVAVESEWISCREPSSPFDEH